MFISPVDVNLDCDAYTMLKPDVLIVCDKDKIKNNHVYGAPDFVLEVISPSTKKRDYTIKVDKYMKAGVKEYWIIDPYQKKLVRYFADKKEYPIICGFDTPVPLAIYGGKLMIHFENIIEDIEESENVVNKEDE